VGSASVDVVDVMNGFTHVWVCESGAQNGRNTVDHGYTVGARTCSLVGVERSVLLQNGDDS
jgi:hypothetical protein